MNKKILIADDDKTILTTAKIFLEGKGNVVITADNGIDAVLMTKTEKPDVAILDVRMPGKDGFEVCKEIKENKETKNTIVVIFSGIIKEIEKGFDYGADDCLTKPVDWNKFVKRIEELDITTNN